MQANNKSNTLQLLSLAIVMISLLCCKKEMPPKFSGEDFTYFVNTNILEANIRNIENVYVAEKEFSFLISLNQMDTLKLNEVYNHNLLIRAEGRMSDKNRPVLLEVEGNGVEYAVLPPLDSIYISANESVHKLKLKLVRPPLSDTATKTLTLTLKNNQFFKPGNHTWYRITYKFGNMLQQPAYFDRNETFYGNFSAAKMIVMQEAVNRKGAAYWQSNANMTTLNNFIDLQAGKHLYFDPFSFNDLYNFIDDTEILLTGISSGPLRDAYNSIKTEIISLSKTLLIEKKNAGHPVLDGNGNEISFP